MGRRINAFLKIIDTGSIVFHPANIFRKHYSRAAALIF